jgi:broad specificity phosphatase PhoE
VAHAQARLKEAAKLGFSQAVAPPPRTEKGERQALATASSLTSRISWPASRRDVLAARPVRTIETGRRRVTAE